ncbi:hydroxysqualene dehydroxylase HpnE [Candidatus Ferrigenium straubiae]|jgi:squalene-associated FAD-dependent desaturase|uniref:hydroxysqualene dehydroxylase HpnE n=1 Tax=Candidatus Ferrigenium straubiae TaxID=2919506 RepID=UPI003F4A97AE
MAEELKGIPSPQPSPASGRGSNREKQFLNPAIIGGGYAGMAAAVTLAARGIPVTVFESARQLGGRARGVLHQDTQLDNGQHLLLGCYRETLRLIELVGGDIERDFLRLPLQLDLHGEFSLRAPRLPAPLHLMTALLGAQGLSLSERLKAARFMLALRRMNFRLPSPVHGRGVGGEGNDTTVTELLARHGQDADLTFKLWEPLCIAALNTPIRKASAQVLLNVLRDALNRKRSDSDMLLPRVDFSALFPQRAAGYVERHGGRVLTSCGVEAIVPHGNGIELATAQGMERFSHVVCAAPPLVAAKLLRPLAGLESAVAQIEGLEHQPIYTVYLRYPAHVALPHPMIGLHQRFSQWLFDKGRIAGQHGLLAAVISAEGIHQELPQEQLAQKVIAELREEFDIGETPEWFRVIAEKRATFACVPSLQRPPPQTALPGLLLAGDYTAGDYPATLEGAVLSGVRCAGLISSSR